MCLTFKWQQIDIDVATCVWHIALDCKVLCGGLVLTHTSQPYKGLCKNQHNPNQNENQSHMQAFEVWHLEGAAKSLKSRVYPPQQNQSLNINSAVNYIFRWTVKSCAFELLFLPGWKNRLQQIDIDVATCVWHIAMECKDFCFFLCHATPRYKGLRKSQHNRYQNKISLKLKLFWFGNQFTTPQTQNPLEPKT
jgi:hypothetical protein